MRKKNISYFFDTLMWYILYLLPIIAFVIMLCCNGVNGLTLSTAMSNCGFGIFSDNIVLTTLSEIFGSGGVFPLFANPDLLAYFAYFICVMLVHLAVDVLLFIPRYAHYLMDCFGGKTEK